MKKLLSSLVLTGVLLAPTAQAADWNGAYAGLAGASATADADFFYLDVQNNGPWESEGTIFGGFAGYNVQNGNFVFGGEISYMVGELLAPDDSFYDNLLDVKARAGYAAGSALIYGTAGYSTYDISELYAAPDSDPLTGFGYGVGFDMMVTEKIFVGLEYFTRAIEGDLTYPTDPNWSIEGNATTITARVGMNF